MRSPSRRPSGYVRGLAAVLICSGAGFGPAAAASGAAITLDPCGFPAALFSAAELRFGVSGPGQIAHLGAAVTAAGDLNGDGWPDFCAGAPDGGSPRTGLVQVYFGRPGGFTGPDLILRGTQDGERFGTAVAGVGDLNGDGYDDLVVGSPTYSQSGFNRGRILVYLGGAAMDSEPDRVIVGDPLETPFLGTALSALGDWDGDGRTDFAVASTVLASGDVRDHVEIHLGAADIAQMTRIRLNEAPRSNWFGSTMAPVGDWDGDGRDDLAVASPQGIGRVEIHGYPRRLLFEVESAVEGDGFGRGVALLRRAPLQEDLLAVAAPNAVAGGGRTGEILLVGRDGAVRNRLRGAPGLALGAALDAAADFDGDGVRDLLGGAPGGPFQRGEVHVWSGRHAGSPCAALIGRVISPRFGSTFGAAAAFVAGADGPLPDLLVGAPDHTEGPYRVGRIELHRARRPRLAATAPGRTFYPGERDTVRWTGGDPVDVALSADDGVTWTTIATGVGGGEGGAHVLAIPSLRTLRARARVAWTDSVPRPATQDVSVPFRIAARVPEGRAARRRIEVARGAGPGERSGSIVARMRDIDGDGADEVLVAAPDADGAAGRVTLHLSGGGVRTWRGESPGDRFGAALAAVHDLDGDGNVDLAIGAPGSSAIAPRAGRVYVFSGATQGTPSQVIDGAAAGHEAGAALCVLTRPESSGGTMLMVGAPGMDAVRIHRAAGGLAAEPDAIIGGGSPGGRFGAVAVDAGDLDGDGLADLAVGAPGAGGTIPGAGEVAVFTAFPPPGTPAAPWLVVRGGQPFEALGSALAAGADLDDDGWGDLAIGSPGRSGPLVDGGRVTVLFGGPDAHPSKALQIEGSASGGRLGSALAIPGDLDGDGIADLAAGAPFAGPQDAGLVQVHRGLPRMSAAPDFTEIGAPGERLGFALGAAGDPRRAGFHDLLIGAPYANDAGIDAGRVERLEAERYFLLRPNGGEVWQAGTNREVEWLGDVPAEVQLSLDGGGSFHPISNVRVRNRATVRVPAEATSRALVRVVSADPARAGWDQSDAPFRIRTAVDLLRFDLRVEADGVHLEWETHPAPGLEGIRGYRLERVDAGGLTLPLQAAAEVTVARSWVDPAARPGAVYRLAALDATGRWVELGERRVPGIEGLAARPVPWRGSGALELAFVAPIDAGGWTAGDLEVGLYDAAGREVALLARGRREARTGIVRLEWDGRLGDGARAAPGVYFVRAAAPSAGFRLTRRVVIVR